MKNSLKRNKAKKNTACNNFLQIDIKNFMSEMKIGKRSEIGDIFILPESNFI